MSYDLEMRGQAENTGPHFRKQMAVMTCIIEGNKCHFCVVFLIRQFVREQNQQCDIEDILSVPGAYPNNIISTKYCISSISFLVTEVQTLCVSERG